MAEEFKIELGAELKSGWDTNIRQQINGLQANPIDIQVQLDNQSYRRVQNQIDNIRQQIQALGNITINFGGGGNRGIGSTTNAMQRAQREVNNLYNQIKNMELKVGKLGQSGFDSDNITEYNRQLNVLRNTYNQLVNSLNGQNVNLDNVFSQIDEARTSISNLTSVVDNAQVRLANKIQIKIDNGSLQNQINAIQQRFNNLNVTSDNVTNGIGELQRLLGAMDDSDSIEYVTANYRNFEQILEAVTNQIKELERVQQNTQRQQQQDTVTQRLIDARNALSSDIDVWLNNNTAAAKQFGDRLNVIKSQIQGCDKAQLDHLKAEFQQVKKEANLAGVATKTFGDRLADQFSKLSTYLSATAIFSYASQALQSMYDNVVEIDTAMTDLKKVTDETDAAYQNFLNNAGKKSQELGRSVSSFIQQSANWAKMGYDTIESAKLAEVSSIYSNVADVDDATAVNDIVTAMKAFNIEAENAISIIDPMNKISNEFAVTAAGLGEGLSRAASTMATSGTDLEHTLALLTGISEITQSPEEAGNFLKTAIARIQGMKGTLEELGEEVDESVDSISKVQTQVLNLTHGKVNIFDSTGEFRDYYDIMKDIAAIVDDLESTERAQLYEILFGKNRMNQGAAMIQAFQSGQIDKALKSALESTGSAYAEQEKWMESLEAKLGQLEAAWQSLSKTFLDSEFLGNTIDLLTDLVNILDWAIEHIGTFGTIASGITIFEIFKKNNGYISKFASELKKAGVSFTDFGSSAKIAGSSLKSFITSASGIATVASLAVTAISAIVQAIKNAEAEAARIRQETIEANNEILDSVDTFEQAYIKYANKTSLTTDEENELVAAINGTITALGYKSGAIQGVIDKNNDYIESLENVAIAELQAARDTAFENLAKAKEQLQSDSYSSWTGSKISIDLGNSKSNDTVKNIRAIVKETMADYIDTETKNAGRGTSVLQFELEPIDWDSDNTDMEAVVDYYQKLINLKETLKTKASEENDESYITSDIYKNITSTINELSGGVEEYLTQQYNLAKYDYEIKNGIPKTIEEYQDMKNAILGNIDASQEYKDAIAGIADAEWGQIFDLDGYNDTLNKLTSIREKFVSSNIFQSAYADSAQSAQEELDNFNTWLNSLDSDKLDIVYQISINNSDEAREKMLNQLKELSNGGNVDLTVRPIIDTQELLNAGWENAGEGSATVFTSTFSNKAAELGKDGGIAMNFTPIMVDENGNYIGTLSPEELNQYANEVISGTREDDLGLKIGATYEGSDAIARAEADAETIHNLHEQYLLTPSLDEWVLEDWQSSLENFEIPEESKISFSDLIADTDSDADFIDKVDTYVEKIGTLKEALESFQKGDFSNSDFNELIKTFPELADNADDLDSAIIELLGTMNTDITSEFASQFGNLETDEDIAALENFMNSVLKLGEVVGNTNFSIDVETDTMETFYAALNESVSGTGLSSESIKNIEKMYSGLEGYDPSKLFEKTEHGIHLNVQELRLLQSEYENVKKLDLQKDIQDLKQEYNNTKKELEGLTEGTEEYYAKSAELDSIESKIESIQTLIAQYEGLTSAYNKWLEAQSTADEDDMYTTLSDGLEDIKELYKSGRIGTDDFRQSIQLMTDEDVSTASIDRLLEVYDEGYATMQKFFTGNSDGLLNFLNTAKGVSDKLGEEWVTLDEDGKWHIDFGVGGDEEIAKAISEMEGLQISTEEVQILLRALAAYGFDVNLDSAYSSIEELQSKVEETEAKLKETCGEDYEIVCDIYCNDTELETEEKKVKARLQELDSMKSTPEVEAETADLQARLDVLAKRMSELNQPTFMSIDVSQVDTELQDALIILQEYQDAVNNLAYLEVKGADTSEIEAAKAKVDEYAEAVNKLPEDVKTDIGLTTDEINAETLKSQIGNIEFPVTADTTQAETQIGNINGTDFTVDVITSGNEALDSLKSAIDEIRDKTVTITADVIGTDLVNALKDAIDKVKKKTVKVGAKVFGTSDVKNLYNAIKSLFDKTVNVTTVTNTVNNTINNVTNNNTTNTDNNPPNRAPTVFDDTRTLANGTAYAYGNVDGNAYKQGDWGLKNSGVALGGELGRETIVRDGHYFTIGDNGAEFFKYKKGDIIFNHKQTEELFKNGKVTSGNGRGKALSTGTAFVHGSDSGKAFSDAGGSIIVNGSVTTTPSGNGSSNNSKSSSDSANDFKETFDWIEVAIDRIERAISRLDLKANSTYKSWSSRNKNLKKEISKIGDEISLQEQAYDRYMKEADSVGLSSEWEKKVQNGEIDIDTITDKDFADKIKTYQEWYNKALDCKDVLDELYETEAELYQTSFDNIVSQYDGILSLLEHDKNMIEEYINQTEASGHLVSKEYYEALIKTEQSNIKQLEKERTALIDSLQEAVNSGTIEEGSEAYNEMVSQINDVTLAIEESNSSIIELNNSIKDIDWKVFDLMQEKISQITSESDFLIDLMSNGDLYEDNGQLTDTGLATMGLHGQNYNVYMEQAAKYAEEMKNIEEDLAKDPYNQDLINRKQELLELQQESILAAENEKQAIIDMVSEGIELELDAIDELISKYKDQLDTQKSLYEYNKKIKKQTQEISNIEKQLSAYSNDTSEEVRAKVQELKVSLEEAKENLEETEYEKYISDQKQLLDDLYDEYEFILNQRLDNIDALIEDVVTEINTNASTINETISNEASNVGYILSSEMQSIWGEGSNIVTTFENGIANATTTINTTLNAIVDYISRMVEESDDEAVTNIENVEKSSNENQVTKNPTETPKTETPKENTQKKETETPKEKSITVGGKINAGSAKIYEYAGDTSGETQYFKNDPIYTVLKEQDGYLQVRHHKASSGVTGWFKKSDVKAYKTGVQNLKDDEVAWTQDGGQEFIIRPSDGAILTPLAKYDSVLNTNASNNLWDVANNPSDFIRDSLNIDKASTQIPVANNISGNSYDNDFEMNINLPNVMNYEQFKYAMQHDKNFEKMVRAMTVDKLFGGSSLKKFNC